MVKEELKYELDEEGVVCPCCLMKKQSINEVSKFIDQIKSLENNPSFFDEARSIYFESAKEYKSDLDFLKIKWACNECFGRKDALVSETINKQRKSFKPPVFAFFDLKLICQTCSDKFIFRKEEWKHWIDKLDFFYQTTKKYCDQCQPIELLKKKLSKKITVHRDSKFGNNYVDLAIEISEIYRELGMNDKGKGYLKTIINQLEAKGEKELRNQIIKVYNCW